jgi:hypothetical protein
MCFVVEVFLYTPQHTEKTAAHCNTLQHSATHCNTLQAEPLIKTACVLLSKSFSAHCNRRNTPQHTATHCNTLQHTTGRAMHQKSVCFVVEVFLYALQYIATNSNTLQHSATLCIKLHAETFTKAACVFLSKSLSTHCKPPQQTQHSVTH